MTAALDITGSRFGKLVAVGRAGRNDRGQILWRLRCDCGGETTALVGALRAGKHRSCKCGRGRPKHRMHNSRLYRVWQGMRVRCGYPRHPRFARYGGRGITVCEDWQDFEPFRDWALSHGYADHLQIDRINNDGNYEPNNCRFVTAAENMANRGCSK